jgi:hypothetical protein
MRRRRQMLIVLSLLFVPRSAYAQLDNPSWGLTFGVSPLWKTSNEALSSLLDADVVDLHGPEFRVGVVRGTTYGGEWGLTLVHKRFKQDSDVQLTNDHGRAIFVTEDAEMLGTEIHRFFVAHTFARRVQLGVNLAGGVARMRGIADGHYTTAPPGSAAQRTTVLTPQIFEFVGRDVSWLPIGKAEFGISTLVGDRLKLRLSGGLNFPGYELVSVSVSFLMGHDR